MPHTLKKKNVKRYDGNGNDIEGSEDIQEQ